MHEQMALSQQLALLAQVCGAAPKEQKTRLGLVWEVGGSWGPSQGPSLCSGHTPLGDVLANIYNRIRVTTKNSRRDVYSAHSQSVQPGLAFYTEANKL